MEIPSDRTASIGVDLVYIPEFKSAWEEPGTVFFHKTFSEWEINRALKKPSLQIPSFFAGRYAAKEAFVKALDGPRLFLGPDIKLEYSEIEIRNDDYGRPFFRFSGELSEYLKKKGLVSARVSISHVEDYAFSEVLLVF